MLRLFITLQIDFYFKSSNPDYFRRLLLSLLIAFYVYLVALLSLYTITTAEVSNMATVYDLIEQWLLESN